MTQLNTPYPATAYLTGFLRHHFAARAPADTADAADAADAGSTEAAETAVEVAQADAALELFLRLFSRAGHARVQTVLAKRKKGASPSVRHFLKHAAQYLETIDPVVRFLQGRDPSLALRIVGRALLPEGPRFAAIHAAEAEAERGRGDEDDADGGDPLAWAFGGLGITDRAKHLASLYVDDLADVIRDGIDPEFELARYGERLAASAPRFDPLRDALEGEPSLVDRLLDELAAELVSRHRPDVVGLTVPFPGNLYGALRIARSVKTIAPATRVLLGGGYVNTELRSLADPRVFDYVDFITLDDGEAPLAALLAHLRDPNAPLLRTFVRREGRVVLESDPGLRDLPQRDLGTPTYAGLPLDRYVSLFEMLNPMHRLWSDGRWNKLTIAHGCYWKQCAFCDVGLDYIARYERTPADLLVDRIEALVAETGQTGFHFVDEAAPPAALEALAKKLLERGLAITWWGNVRFEKAFTPALTELLARSGCVAISGGLEVASDRLLALMKKGVTVEQVARVTRAFTDAGIMVHAYLMYGFPTETEQETIDSLERVRQLFAEGCIQSAFWHRFAATAHSPIGKDPARYGIELARTERSTFARNDLAFVDPTGCDHDFFAEGLRTALYNYMHGMGLDADPRAWFAGRRGTKVPGTSVDPELVRRALDAG
ncbi:MAG: radical SAM protein [Deltaproteobacteria bacterium]|nr:radical SAM protein [Deltaproteobacteria bacterium]